MKKWIILTVLTGVVIQVARKYDIRFEDLRNMIFPKLENLAAKVKLN